MEQIDLKARCRYCVFRSQEAWFAVPAQAVRELTFRPQLVKVPLSDAALAGLCHFRNELLPVLSLAALLAETSSAAGETQMLVLFGARGPWALLVDEVAGLEPLETSAVAAGASHDSSAGTIAGWARFRDQSVRVLEPTRLMDFANRLLDGFWDSAIAISGAVDASKA